MLHHCDPDAGVTASDVGVTVIPLNYGMSNRNPMGQVHFFRRWNDDVASPLSKCYRIRDM